MNRPELDLRSPWLNSAGSLGYTPPGGGWPLAEAQGAFVTAPVGLRRRTPAASRACLPYPGGMLLHTGFPNPGLSAVLKANAARWKRSDLPIWVHILADAPHQAAEMASRLESVDGVMAVELGLSPDITPEAALELVRATLGELPLAVSLPLHRAYEPWLDDLAGLEIAALTLTAPRGALPTGNGSLVHGRLYGPGLFSQVLEAIIALRPLDVPLIAGAGIYRRTDAETLLAHGANAVQVDTALWKGYLED